MKNFKIIDNKRYMQFNFENEKQMIIIILPGAYIKLKTLKYETPSDV